MKRLIVLMLAAILVLASCGGHGVNSDDRTDETSGTDEELVDFVNSIIIPDIITRDDITRAVSDNNADASWATISESGEMIGSIRCYGIFNGCAVIFDETGKQTETTVTVEGQTFSHSSQFALYGYKDGTLREINDAYKAGLLTKKNITVAAERHKFVEQLPEYIRKINVNAKESFFVPDEKTRSEIEEQCKKRDIHVGWGNVPQFPEGRFVQRCYGTVNGCTVFLIMRALLAPETKTIAGYEFFYSSCFGLYCYKDGVLCSLQEAYDNGLLTKDDVGVLAERHRNASDYNSACTYFDRFNTEATQIHKERDGGETT